jgi:hypothetical protein
MQARNIALTEAGCRVYGPGRSTSAMAREVLGDSLAEWLDEG